MTAACLQSPAALESVRGWLVPDDLWDNGLAAIYGAAWDLAQDGEAVSVVSVAARLATAGHLDDALHARLAELAAAEHGCHEAPWHGELVLEASMKRAWLDLASQLMERVVDQTHRWLELAHWGPEQVRTLETVQWERMSLVPTGSEPIDHHTVCARCETGRGEVEPPTPAPVVSTAVAVAAPPPPPAPTGAAPLVAAEPPSEPAATAPAAGTRREAVQAAQRHLASLDYLSPRLRRAIETWQRRHADRLLLNPTTLREVLLGRPPAATEEIYETYVAIVRTLSSERDRHLRIVSQEPPAIGELRR